MLLGMLSLYIFSFLDPWSVGLCTQVSWHWKNLTELDQLRMLKCLKCLQFNWYIIFLQLPLSREYGRSTMFKWWENFVLPSLRHLPKDRFVIADVQPVTGNSPEGKQSPSPVFLSPSPLRKKNQPREEELPPWQSSDKHPTDIICFNYLDSCDPIEAIWHGRRRHEMTSDSSR